MSLAEREEMKIDDSYWYGYKDGIIDGYNKAIDDFRDKICEKYTAEERKENYKQYCCNIKQELVDLAEQLKR